MHIFKSRNPIWLIIDIALMIWLWNIPIYLGALFFTFDTIIQFFYTFFPDMVDAWDKNKKYRALYSLLFLISLYAIFSFLIEENII